MRPNNPKQFNVYRTYVPIFTLQNGSNAGIHGLHGLFGNESASFNMIPKAESSDPKRGRYTLALSTGCIRSSGRSSLRANGCGKGKYTLLGTADNFNSPLSSGLSSSRLTTVQGNCVARWAPRRPGYGSLSVSDQHAH